MGRCVVGMRKRFRRSVLGHGIHFQSGLSALPFSRLRYRDPIKLDLSPFEVRIGVPFFRSRHSPDNDLLALALALALAEMKLLDRMFPQEIDPPEGQRPLPCF